MYKKTKQVDIAMFADFELTRVDVQELSDVGKTPKSLPRVIPAKVSIYLAK
jgi:hypothetical protein